MRIVAIEKTYGRNYYKENFHELVLVKSSVNPTNFFKHEQSIPPLVVSKLIAIYFTY